MSDRDFSINGREFKLNKLDALKQYHIVRRIGPILSDILPALKDTNFSKFSSESAVAKLSEDQKLDLASKAITPIMNGLSRLPDADAELVLFGLLSCVEMKQPGAGWAKIATSTMLMFSDLELPILLQIAGRSFGYNLSGFFAGLPQ